VRRGKLMVRNRTNMVPGLRILPRRNLLPWRWKQHVLQKSQYRMLPRRTNDEQNELQLHALATFLAISIRKRLTTQTAETWQRFSLVFISLEKVSVCCCPTHSCNKVSHSEPARKTRVWFQAVTVQMNAGRL
jgi:hypothetical protein